MMKKTSFGIVLFILGTGALCAQERPSKQIYKTYCAGCHGADLQGNSATSLIKEEWTYGRGRGSITRNIKFGISGTEMAAFGNVLSDEEIDTLVDYIIAVQKISPSQDRPIPSEISTSDYTLRIEKLIQDDIETLWGITFVDSTTALFTERKGTIRRMVNDTLDPKPITGMPPTQELRTGGYMDIVTDPNYHNNDWIYLAYSFTPEDIENDNAPAMTKIVRGRIEGYQWYDQETLFEVPDSLLVRKGNRWGSRFLFDREGYLYFTIGDMDRAEASQDPGKAPGKVYRILPDGSIPEDNPYANEPGALKAVYTVGNRNVQGLDQHPDTGDIWATEHGPMGGDELNILKKGANYGWPVITYGIDYDGDIVSDKTHKKGMEQPVVQWTPSIAVAPAQFVDSRMFPKWRNNLLIGALKFEELRRLVIKDKEVIQQEIILKDYGRVRDIQNGPDGALYVLLNSPDMILRITPK